MGFVSRSSKNKSYRNGHYGSNRYQRKGILGNIFNVFGSGSSHDYSGQHPNQQNSNLSTNPIACSKCNQQIQPGSKFCPQCGEKISGGLFCTACGEKTLPDARFCSKCGAQINS